MKSRQQRRNSGFTLIELVVVVAVLAILAGLVLPKLDTYILKANKGVSASNISGVSRYIQTHRVLNNIYPDKMDSLLDTSGAFWTTTGSSPTDPTFKIGLHPELTGGDTSGLPANTPQKLKLDTLPADGATSAYGRSLNRMGITTVFDALDHVNNAIPGNKFDQPRSLDFTSTVKIATLNVTVDASGTLTGGDGDAQAIFTKIYGNGGKQPVGAKLVAFGFGPNNSAIGSTLQDVPFYPNLDQTAYYNRFVVFFEAYQDGSRASFKLATGADCDLMADEINEYYTTK